MILSFFVKKNIFFIYYNNEYSSYELLKLIKIERILSINKLGVKYEKINSI